MADIKGKLMGLLQKSPYISCADTDRQYAVNWLINNGVTVRERGRWEYYSTTMQECSNCHRHTARHKFKYCPHCGAVMEDRYYE